MDQLVHVILTIDKVHTAPSGLQTSQGFRQDFEIGCPKLLSILCNNRVSSFYFLYIKFRNIRVSKSRLWCPKDRWTGLWLKHLRPGLMAIIYLCQLTGSHGNWQLTDLYSWLHNILLFGWINMNVHHGHWYIWFISPRCVRIYIVKITSTFSNLVPVFLD